MDDEARIGNEGRGGESTAGRWLIGPVVWGLVVLLMWGCGLTTTVETSRQLESGDRVVSTNFGWPGYYLILPRVNVLGMWGVGDGGDLGPHVGLNRTSVNAGLGGRWYPTSWLIAGMRADVEWAGEDAEVRGEPVDAGMVARLVPRVVTVTDDDRRTYGGVQGSLIRRFDTVGPDGEAGGSRFAESIGVLGGFEHLFTRRGVQLEVVVSLIAFDERVTDRGVVPSVQLNLGGYLFSSS